MKKFLSWETFFNEVRKLVSILFLLDSCFYRIVTIICAQKKLRKSLNTGRSGETIKKENNTEHFDNQDSKVNKNHTLFDDKKYKKKKHLWDFGGENQRQ